MTSKQVITIQKLKKATVPIAQICKQVSYSPATIYWVLKNQFDYPEQSSKEIK